MRALSIAIAVGCLAEAAVFLFLAWPRPLHVAAPHIVQVTETTEAGTRIYMPQKALVGKLGEYHDELFAFLMFDHYRAVPELRNVPLLLEPQETASGVAYSIWVRLPDDLIEGPSLLAQLQADGWISAVRYQWIGKPRLREAMAESELVTEAYDNPAPDALEQLNDSELTVYLGHFIRFKSLTDYRIEHHTDTSLCPLNEEEAEQLASDMITVSRFYGVPLRLMLGIGAMENNYMNAPGDLTHTIWKRRAEHGDIVLERRRHRVLVKDDALGVWQITRKELRRAQQLYEKDKRDYAQLPEWLRPPQKLDWDHVEPTVLTTYAGLLLRDLLDHCHDDVIEAAGAYNGTLRHPNLRYAEGVQLVADYAERVAGNAAAADPLPKAEKRQEVLTEPVVLQGAEAEKVRGGVVVN